jgi:hypothetical protein
MRADDAWKDEHEPEESEAVQGRDRAMGFDPVHRLESRQEIHSEAKQPDDVPESEMNLEDELRRHVASWCLSAVPIGTT